MTPVFVCQGCHNKTPQTGETKQQTFVFIFHSLGGWKSKIQFQQRQFLLKPLALAGRWLPSYYIFTRACLCVHISPLFLPLLSTTTFLLGQGLTLMTSFTSIIHLEPNILEYGVKWSLGNITMNQASGGDRISAVVLLLSHVRLFETPMDCNIPGIPVL